MTGSQSSVSENVGDVTSSNDNGHGYASSSAAGTDMRVVREGCVGIFANYTDDRSARYPCRLRRSNRAWPHSRAGAGLELGVVGLGSCHDKLWIRGWVTRPRALEQRFSWRISRPFHGDATRDN